MDPDKALAEIRAEIKSYHERPHGMSDSDRLAHIVEHVEALDEWLASGGFQPKAWGGDPLPP